MSFASEIQTLPSVLWWLFAANLIWILIYDTIYAMVDRDDDIKIGVKSTAVLFAQYDQKIIALLQLVTLALLVICAMHLQAGAAFYVCLFVGALVFLYQQLLVSKRSRESYFKAFKFSHWFGVCIWIGWILNFL